MARSFAQIHLTIWNDDDFLALTEAAQRLYFLLFSQPDMTYCGVVGYRPGRWSKLSSSSSVGKLRKAIAELEKKRFIVFDRGTEEVWVRSFMKSNKIHDQEQLHKSMKASYEVIASPTIKAGVYDSVPKDKRAGMTPPKGTPDPQGGGQGAAQGGHQGNGTLRVSPSAPCPAGDVIGVTDCGSKPVTVTAPVTEPSPVPEPVHPTDTHTGTAPPADDSEPGAAPKRPEPEQRKAEERRAFRWTDRAMDLYGFEQRKFKPTLNVMRLVCPLIDDRLLDECLTYCAGLEDKPRTPTYLRTAITKWAADYGITVPQLDISEAS